MLVESHSAEGARVLSEAAAKAAQRLQIASEQLAQILDVDLVDIEKLLSGERLLNEHSDEWARAQLLIRLFLSLQSLVPDDHAARAWIHSMNQALSERPIDLIVAKEGLEKVFQYLESHRFCR